MSLVELRRNSSPHIGSVTLQASPVWRKSSHPPFSTESTMDELKQRVLVPNRGVNKNETKIEVSPPLFQNNDGTWPTLPNVYNKMLLHSDDFKSLIRSITSEAKDLIRAETCSLFILDSETNELVANVFDRSDNISEIRVRLDQGIVGRVATVRTMMNIREVSKCPYFYAGVDQLTGFQTKSILCFPIVDNAGTFVGVAELCNRTGRTAFTRHDEQKAHTFAVYCATSISHCLLHWKVREAQRRAHMAAELLIHEPQITEEEVQRLADEPIQEWRFWHQKFDRFSFSPRSIGNGDTYVSAAKTMFDDLGFMSRYRMSRRKLSYFVLRVARGYRDVAYHNWSHAFAVAHFCWLTLRTQTARSGLDEMERLALLIACLCHDIDHRGTTNAFHEKSKTPLAELYSSEGSVLERHHYAQTVAILQMTECNFLDQLTRTQYQTVLSHIRDVILATDIAVHVRKVPRIKAMVDEGYNLLSPDHHYLFMCLIMTASDLSDQSKDFSNSKAIAENIYREFFTQGDLEKEMGSNPSEMMDRDRACVPKIQIDFMDNIGLPVFEMISKLVPDSLSTFEAISYNRKCWAALDNIFEERRQPVLGLEYLHDEDLEKEVVEAVCGQKNNRAK